MQVTIELPDELADQIRKTSGDVARRVLEAFAIDCYRSGKLTGWQARRLLGLETRFELDALLRRAGVFRDYAAPERAGFRLVVQVFWRTGDPAPSLIPPGVQILLDCRQYHL